MPRKLLSFILNSTLFVFALSLGLFLIEGAVRLKHRAMQDYDIEQWKYAKTLKVISHNPLLGHEHRPNAQSILQSVQIRTNELGMRGAPIPNLNGKRVLLVLGTSMTLGWGVSEQETLPAQLQDTLGSETVVLNGGIGNYNTVRYIELFFQKFAKLNPTDIVIHFFPRDAEIVEPPRINWILSHSQLAVTVWLLLQRNLFYHRSLEEQMRTTYAAGSLETQMLENALEKLSKYASQHNIRLYLAMMPDTRNLSHYPFFYVHNYMRQLALKFQYQYIDLYPALRDLSPKDLWVLPNDPHPNRLGYQRIASSLASVLRYPVTGQLVPQQGLD